MQPEHAKRMYRASPSRSPRRFASLYPEIQSAASRLESNKLTLEFNPNPMRHRLDALRPHRLVQLGVDADVGGAHRLAGKVDDGLDSPGCALLEGAAVNALVQVDRVLARYDVLESRASLTAGLSET